MRLHLCMGLAAALVARAAGAYDVGSTAGDYNAVTRIDRGAKLLGLSAVAVVDYARQSGSSSFRATVLGGLGFGYFVRDSMAIGLDAFAYYKRTQSDVAGAESEVGGVGLLTAAFYARLGHSFFLRPGLGLGGFYGFHRAPLPGGVLSSTGVFGGAASRALGLVFFATPHVMLQAAPQVGVFAGSDGGGFALSVDGGFSVGLRYLF